MNSAPNCLRSAVTLGLGLILAGYASAQTVLGQYPLCEASAALAIDCPDAGGPCLLIGDNEVQTFLFLFPIHNKTLSTASQTSIPLGAPGTIEISDIEALTALPGGKVLVLGSHSRNAKCEAKKKRRRYAIIEHLAAVPPKAVVTKSGRIACARLFDTEAMGQAHVAGACRSIERAERAADAVEEALKRGEISLADAKIQCNDAHPYNAEGGVNVSESETPEVWIGLRSPLMRPAPADEPGHGLAMLLHMHGLGAYSFDRVRLLDMEGRGVRDLAYSDGWVWIIAGPPEDRAQGEEEAFQLRRFPVGALGTDDPIQPELVAADLPPSAEGITILGDKAFIVIDGGRTDTATDECKVPSGLVIVPVPSA